jgi:hypothetical protein
MSSAIAKYTITGAADWPMVLVMGGMLAFLITILIALTAFYGKQITNGFSRCIDKLDEKINTHILDDSCHCRHRGDGNGS